MNNHFPNSSFFTILEREELPKPQSFAQTNAKIGTISMYLVSFIFKYFNPEELCPRVALIPVNGLYKQKAFAEGDLL